MTNNQRIAVVLRWINSCQTIEQFTKMHSYVMKLPMKSIPEMDYRQALLIGIIRKGEQMKNELNSILQ